MYSNPILSFETGQRLAAASRARSTGAGSPADAARQQAGAIRQVTAEQFIGAFSTQRYGGAAALVSSGKKPDRQRAGIGVRLIAVVGELVDRARQILFGIEIELMVLGPITAQPPART